MRVRGKNCFLTFNVVPPRALRQSSSETCSTLYNFINKQSLRSAWSHNHRKYMLD